MNYLDMADTETKEAQVYLGTPGLKNNAVIIKEQFLHALMQEIYKEEVLNFYDFSGQQLNPASEYFAEVRHWAHHLVKCKLATYTDPEHTCLQLTNYGIYWMMHGGYMTFLRDEHNLKERSHYEKEQHREELIDARLKLTHYRLVGFWLALVISTVGFLLSVVNLYLYFSNSK